MNSLQALRIAEALRMDSERARAIDVDAVEVPPNVLDLVASTIEHLAEVVPVLETEIYEMRSIYEMAVSGGRLD